MKTTALASLAVILGPVLAQDQEPETVQLSLREVVEKTVHEAGAHFLFAGDLPLDQNSVSFPASRLKGEGTLETCFRLLRSGGIAAVRTEDSGKPVWKLTPAIGAHREGLPTYANPEDLPRSDEFCRLLIPLKNASVRDIHAVLINLVSYSQGVALSQDSRSLILADFAGNLRSLSKLVERMDAAAPKPLRGEVIFTFHLLKGGQSGGEPVEVPKEVAAYEKVLRAHAPHSRYELLDVGSVRVDLTHSRSNPQNASIALGGDMDRKVEVVAVRQEDQTVRLDAVRLLQRAGKGDWNAVLQTVLSLRDGERAVVGSCRPPNTDVGWPLILLAEMKTVE